MKTSLRYISTLALASFMLVQAAFAQVPASNRSRLDIKPKAKTSTLSFARTVGGLRQTTTSVGEIRPSRSAAIKNFYKEYFRNASTFTATKKPTKPLIAAEPTLVSSEARLGSSEEASSIEKLFSNDKITISNLYPNPADNVVNVDYEVKGSINEVKLVFFNMFGMEVKSEELDKNERRHRIAVDNLPNGHYFYQLNLDGKTPISRKLIIRHQ